MSLVHTASRHYLKLGDHLLQKNWPQLMVWMYVKSVSHMTMTKIHQILLKCLCLMKNFLNYRSEMRKIKNLRARVKNGEYSDFYKIENDILYRMVIENNHKFDAAVLPAKLINTALFLGHNQSGHNGFQRTYAAIKRIYYWKGMHKDILKYCKGCSQCTKHRVEKRKFIEQSFKTWCTTHGIHFHGLGW